MGRTCLFLLCLSLPVAALAAPRLTKVSLEADDEALTFVFEAGERVGADAVEVWGSGNPLREFLYRDDLCAACRLLLEDYDGEDIVNVGSGEEVSIADLARMVAEATDYRGQISFDASRPDGAARKVLDSQPMRSLGWQPETSLKEGIRRTVNWFQQGEKV